jgi:L-alanine-DL-glutamate epimerase-like enolase superfamily enzyme
MSLRHVRLVGRFPAIDRVEAAAYSIPTETPESDGTLEWDRTTLIVAEVYAAGQRGIGYTYGSAACATLIRERLAQCVAGHDPMAVTAAWTSMARALRNAGRPGIGAMAIAAVDTALWDLKARLLGLPLVSLLGTARESIPIYGSGGFTSYGVGELQDQLAGWTAQGITRVKMKVGRDAAEDVARVRAARRAIGDGVELFVDANGAYGRKQALAQAVAFADERVTWFEEPVQSGDLDGLRLLRDRAPPGMDIVAGEYGSELADVRRMLEARAVDVVMADATRCGGITGFLAVAALCDAWNVPLSSHTAPSLHVHLCCAIPAVRHLEWFHDHVRIERMLFDGVVAPSNGAVAPDLARPGLGIELRRADAARVAV